MTLKAKSCKRRALLLVVVGYAVGTAVALSRGYRFGSNVVVRCRKGHLFTTTWIPGASLKAVRLGWWRFQKCPVGQHWDLVVPVRESDLSDSELEDARKVHDVRLP
jgi:hypothetical protein